MDKKKITKKQRNIIIASVLAVVIIAGACFAVFKPDKKLQVETVQATKQSINETLDTTGTVSPASQDSFILPSGAKIISLNVKEGDVVEAGDVIATFDLASLNEALNEKESAYEKAQSAYKNAQTTSQQSKTKVAEVKKQISALEKEIAELEQKSEKVSNNDKGTSAVSKPQVNVSESLVKRFVSIAKLFGVEYSNEEAEKILINMLSAGSSMNDLSSLMDNLNSIAGASGSFDMSAFTGMAGSSELMSAEMSLIQLKAQLATLELQSDSSYVSTFKMVADRTKEDYLAAQTQIDSMKNGWIATAKGIVSEVNLTAEGNLASNTGIDISSVLSAVTSGADVTSLLTSLMNNGQVAVKVLYYPLVADISLNKYDVLEVDLNQDVIITSASGKDFIGKVSYVSAVATSSNGLNINSIMGGSSASSSIPAQVTIHDADNSVIVGVDVQVSIITETVENAVVLPVEVICIDGEDVFVYALEDGKAVKKNVELGIASDTHYQILSGINESDVLIKNTVGLDDGVKVEAK